MIQPYDPKTGTCTDGRVTWLADSAHVELHRRLVILANALREDCSTGCQNCGACEIARDGVAPC